MNAFYPVTTLQTSRAEILTIGLDASLRPACSFPNAGNRFRWKSYSSVSEAKIWLRQKDHGKPQMVLADYQQMERDQFAWVRQFRQDDTLQYVPVVLFNCPKSIDPRQALFAGVDDFFQHESLDWDMVLARGRQLQRIRRQLFHSMTPSVALRKNNLWKWSKRSFDILASTFLLLLFSPLCLIIAISIKLESGGPIIYRSKRAGQYFRVFDFLKFRSMHVNADQHLAKLGSLNQYGDKGTPFLKIQNDPRITRVGRFIRKTSLDELPQLINVLKGDMSLVGNRPLPLYEAEQLCKEETAERFSAPAGITGLWQVSKRGKSEMSASERINLDIEYSRKSSLWLDVKIVFMTVPAMIQHENV